MDVLAADRWTAAICQASFVAENSTALALAPRIKLPVLMISSTEARSRRPDARRGDLPKRCPDA